MKYILWLALVLMSGVYLCKPTVDPDLFWHIVVGRWILANGTVPTTEHWNIFALGNQWIAYSWATETLVALVESWYATKGLLVLEVLLGIFLTASLCFCLSKIAKDYFFGTILGILATVSCVEHFTLRPQSLIWALFIWVIFGAERIFEKNSLKSGALIVAISIVLWANCHLTASMALITVFLWLFPENGRPGKLFFSAIALAFIATLITPYFGAEWLVLISKSAHPFKFSISEFRPATIQDACTAFLILFIVLLACFVVKAPKLFSWPKFVLLAGFTLAGLMVVKFMPFAVICAAALIAELWARAQRESNLLGNLAEGFKRLESFIGKIPKEGLSFLVLCVAVVHFYGLWLNPGETVELPKRAMDFFQQKQLPHPLLHTFGQGGYVMYRFSDAQGNVKYPVFIDGRTNVGSHKMWEMNYLAVNGMDGWQGILELTKPETILWRSDSPLVRILEASGKWCPVFKQELKGKGNVVFVKKEYFENRKAEFGLSECGQQ